jgi:hypothetical protein
MILKFQKVVRNNNEEMWMGHELIEIDRLGNILWNWNTFDHISYLDFDPEIMDVWSPYNGAYDWLHTNAIIYDARDNSVYISIRHLSRVVKIDYNTGNIIWSLGKAMPSGDVPFGDKLFSFQHAADVLPNGNLILYNNDNRTEIYPRTSSVFELSVDPEAPEPVEIQWEYKQDFFTISRGDADRLRNGNTLVAAGSSGRIMEISPEGGVIWELETPAVIYRAERVPSLYPLPFDADGDDDIDEDDLNDFYSCYSGTGNKAIHRNCLMHDFDFDGDVDFYDYLKILQNYTGPIS